MLFRSILELNHSISKGGILGTIILPNDLKILSIRLPKPNYNPKKNISIKLDYKCKEEYKRSISSSQLLQKPEKNKSNDFSTIEDQKIASNLKPYQKQNIRDLNHAHKHITRSRPNLPSRDRLPFPYDFLYFYLYI